MSNGYFAADPQRQSEGLSEDQFRKSANAPESANSPDSGRPKSSGNTESSYFPPVETLIERPVSTGPEGLRSPAMLEVNTPGGGIDNDNGQMRHEGMSKVERSGLGVTLDRLASLDINTDESAISLDETLDADRLAPGSTANARRASHDESSIPGSRNSLDERRPVKTEGNARRASFDNDAARRKDRADFGKSIWS